MGHGGGDAAWLPYLAQQTPWDRTDHLQGLEVLKMWPLDYGTLETSAESGVPALWTYFSLSGESTFLTWQWLLERARLEPY